VTSGIKIGFNIMLVHVEKILLDGRIGRECDVENEIQVIFIVSPCIF
jgi:hypothetical protein